jgi:hypothetical protein
LVIIDKTVLKNINFTIEKGQNIAVIERVVAKVPYCTTIWFT